MVNGKLPDGWKTQSLSEVVDDGLFVDGDWVESKDQDPNGDVRLIQLADIGDGYFRNRSDRFLTSQKAKELNCTLLEKGDLLVARMPDPLGRACIFPGDTKKSVTVVDVCVIRTQNVEHRWLMHTINSPQFRANVESLQSGSTRKRISRKNLGKIELPVPPLHEQERIVAKIEELFTQLEAGRSALERVGAGLRRYKASVLKAAVEGKLVDGKLTNENGDLPDGWRHTTIDAFLSKTRTGLKTGPFGSLLKKHEHQESGIPVLGIENIAAMKFVHGSKIHITKEKSKQLEGYAALPGDVLISRSGTVGEVCVVPENLGEARISTNVMRLVLDQEIMSPDFFVMLFNGSPFVLDQVTELCKGSTRDFLNQSILKSIVFPLPPLEAQRRIVAEVERRLSVARQVESAVEEALVRAARLRQAVLRSAFEGRL